MIEGRAGSPRGAMLCMSSGGLVHVVIVTMELLALKGIDKIPSLGLMMDESPPDMVDPTTLLLHYLALDRLPVLRT